MHWQIILHNNINSSYHNRIISLQFCQVWAERVRLFNLSVYIFSRAPLHWFNFIPSRANFTLPITRKSITVFSQWRHKCTCMHGDHHFRPGLLKALYDTALESNLNGFWHILLKNYVFLREFKWFQSEFHILSGRRQLLEHLSEHIISGYQRLL